MSKRAWFVAIALGLIAILAAWYGWHQVRIYQIEKAEQRQSAATTDARNVYQCLRGLWLMEATPFAVCLYEVAQADPDAERSNYDLQAQQEMAVWAFAMFLSSIAGVLVTGVGVVYVARTLRLTRRATDAAVEAVEVTRELGGIQVRAFVTVGDINVSNFEVGHYPKIRLTIKNTGQSPANRFQIVTTFRSVDRIDGTKFFFEGDKWRGVVIDLNPGLSAPQETTLPLMTAEQYDLFIKKEAFIVFYGIARYKTVFGKPCRIVFCHYLNVDRLQKRSSDLTPTTKHNRGS